MPRAPRDADPLPPALLHRARERLGVSSPISIDVEGLHRVYRAWCERVPFDNVRKMIALRTGVSGALPGADAIDFFENWLEHGCGGTCWPSSNALFELVRALGFDARRVAGSMRDTGVIGHGSVKVRIGGEDWLVDSSLLTGVPLPLTRERFVSDDPVFAAEVEWDDAGSSHVVWCHLPPHDEYTPCRLLVDPSSHAEYVERYESSRGRSPFNQVLYARVNRPGGPAEMIVLAGDRRISRTSRGDDSRRLSGDELLESLRRDIGLSQALISQWVECGGLDATLGPPMAAPAAATALPPPYTPPGRQPPSRRSASSPPPSVR